MADKAKSSQEERKARQAAALRDNLRKRKAQTRALKESRQEPAKRDEPPAEG